MENFYPLPLIKNFQLKLKEFFLFMEKKKYKRGDHAHKKCTQIFFAIKGKIKINMKYKNTNKIVFLNENR